MEACLKFMSLKDLQAQTSYNGFIIMPEELATALRFKAAVYNDTTPLYA